MVGLLSADWESRDLVRTVTARGLSPTSLPMSISAWSPVGESTSVTFLPSAYTAYPVTGPDEGGRVTGCQVTRRVPSCGPASTWISWARSERVGGVFEKKKKTLSLDRSYAVMRGFFKEFSFTCGGSGRPLARVLKSVYAPGASSGGGPVVAGVVVWPAARRCFARTVTRYCVLGASPGKR